MSKAKDKVRKNKKVKKPKKSKTKKEEKSNVNKNGFHKDFKLKVEGS